MDRGKKYERIPGFCVRRDDEQMWSFVQVRPDSTTGRKHLPLQRLQDKTSRISMTF